MTKQHLNTNKAAIAAPISPSIFRGGVNDCKSVVYKTSKSLKTKTKRAFALLMLALLAPAAAWAQSTFGGGSGTETDPYIISTTAHMHQLANDVNSGIDYMWVYFRLESDLDFQGILYTPIGCFVGDASPTGSHAFSGFFNGNGHTIKNIKIGTVSAP